MHTHAQLAKFGFCSGLGIYEDHPFPSWKERMNKDWELHSSFMC